MPFSSFYIRSLRIAGAAGVLTALAGGLVLAGWACGLKPLTQVNPSWTPMVPMTAVAFVLSGLALLTNTAAMSKGAEPTERWRWTAILLGAVVALIGARRLFF